MKSDRTHGFLQSPVEMLTGKLMRALRWRVWVVERFSPTEWQRTLVWAGVAGVAGGLSTILFREAAAALHALLTGQDGGMVESFRHLPEWRRFVTPVIGGVLAGLVLLLGKRLARGKSSIDYMEAIALGDGRISFRTSLVKSCAALCAIAGGGSIGREGPMVQIASVLSSALGRWRKVSVPQRRLMVACGAAAGIASAYNAPIGGAFFVAEIVLGTIAMESLGPLVVAAVAASLTTRALHHAHTLYQVPAFTLHSLWEIGPYVVLGLVAGGLAPWYLRSLRGVERLFAKSGLPPVVRLAVGGLIVGALAVRVPEVCGNGYSVVMQILNGQLLWAALLGIVVCKWAATSASFGSGMPGGVFTPTLFMGASLGWVFGSGMHAVWPLGAADPQAFALVGMGAFMAAASHAPLMAIILLFEMTLSYDIVLPLMLASTVAYFAAKSRDQESLYGEFMRRKAEQEPERRTPEIALKDLVKADPPVIAPNARFATIAQAFIATRVNYLYVVDEERRFLGAVSLHDIKAYLGDADLANHVLAADILHESFPSLKPDTPLGEALGVFARHEVARLPVLAGDGSGRLVGAISKNDLLIALAERPAPR